jgi:hypothetical protein
LRVCWVLREQEALRYVVTLHGECVPELVEDFKALITRVNLGTD